MNEVIFIANFRIGLTSKINENTRTGKEVKRLLLFVILLTIIKVKTIDKLRLRRLYLVKIIHKLEGKNFCFF